MASLNSMTLLGAETVGRAYGGGMLKLEPAKPTGCPFPRRARRSSRRAAARAASDAVAALLRGGQLLDAVNLVDDVLLVGGLGMPGREVELLRAGTRRADGTTDGSMGKGKALA